MEECAVEIDVGVKYVPVKRFNYSAIVEKLSELNVLRK